MDLKAADVPYETDSGVVDFHSLRGCYISYIVSSGASVKTCQTLARHSTPSLTIGIYAKASLHDISGAVEALPDLTAKSEHEVLRATGTDGSATDAATGRMSDDDDDSTQIITGGGNRTHTGVPAQRILSPQRLPSAWHWRHAGVTLRLAAGRKRLYTEWHFKGRVGDTWTDTANLVANQRFPARSRSGCGTTSNSTQGIATCSPPMRQKGRPSTMPGHPSFGPTAQRVNGSDGKARSSSIASASRRNDCSSLTLACSALFIDARRRPRMALALSRSPSRWSAGAGMRDPSVASRMGPRSSSGRTPSTWPRPRGNGPRGIGPRLGC